MEPLASGDLAIDVRTDATGALVLEWRGKSNHRQPEIALSPFFAAVVHEAEKQHAPIEMRFERLEFFNSSTITAIIQLVKDLRTRQVKLRLSYDPAHKWQRIFFDALEMFEKDDGLLRIRPAAKA